MDWMAILKFIGTAAASFGSGWGAAVLSDVDPYKAMATGVVSLCTYVIGNQQTSVKLKK